MTKGVEGSVVWRLVVVVFVFVLGLGRKSVSPSMRKSRAAVDV